MEFEALARLCGLSKDQVAEYLSVPARRVDKWIKGEALPSHGSLYSLRRLHEQQQNAADGLIAGWIEAGQPREITYTVGADEESAVEMGWPSRQTQLVVAAIAQVEIAPARVIAQEVKVNSTSPAASVDFAAIAAE